MPPELDYGAMASDILIKGYLRKAKSWNKRYFVLRDSIPAKLEYYESERKWKANNSNPKRTISLEKPWTIDKRKDSKHEYLIVIFTEHECFTMAADGPDVQENWFSTLMKVVKQDPDCVLYKHMWHVVLDNKELEGCSEVVSRLSGPHLVCLTHDNLVFVQANCNGGVDHSRGEPLEIPIGSIRACGHQKEGTFFEPGRGSGIGSGRLWINQQDEVLANNMHQTILNFMYMKKEEAKVYRNRSYSSGSNSGRMRTIRSHYNNPPPSIIGMGKIANCVTVSGKRIRCDSLPATHVTGLHDSRFRTGSEGEHTMRRASRYNTVRGHTGSVSPGMRNRLWIMQGRRNSFAHHRHHYPANHSHTSSFSGSFNTSSAASSNEQLNGLQNCQDLSFASYDGETVEDCQHCYNHSQNSHAVQRNGSISRHIRPYQGNWTPPIQEGMEAFKHCSCCPGFMSCSGDFRFLTTFEHAPPPPDIDPPRNPFLASAELNECMSAIHSNTQSLDDNGSSRTSSLSSSPRQQSVVNHLKTEFDSNLCGQLIEQSKEKTNLSNLPPTPKRQSPLSFSNEDVAESEYTTMHSPGSKYPHQKISSAVKQTDSSVDNTTLPDGYVPMRSLAAKSTSQETGSRRRSLPYTNYRNAVTSNHNQSSTSNCTPQSISHDYSERVVTQRKLCLPFQVPSRAQSCQENSFKSKDNINLENNIDISPSSKLKEESPNPTSKSPDENLEVQSLGEELLAIEKSLNESKQTSGGDSNLTGYSSSSCECVSEAPGYLPMNPINPGHSIFRKSVFSSILSVAEGKPVTPLYPHQKKSKTAATNFEKSGKHIKKPRPFSFRRSCSFSRRNQIQKQKLANVEQLSCAKSTPPAIRTRPPGGDYVNIDYKKARDQQSCPAVLNVSSTCSPTCIS